jgi:predicted nucleic acid-binding protein
MVFEHEASPETDKLLDTLAGADVAVVPQHWLLEGTNVLLAAEASKKKKPAESMEFLALLGKLAIESDAETGHYATTATIALGRKHKLTSYDAAYLELAMRHGVSLATLDKNLRRAAVKEGVPVLPMSFGVGPQTLINLTRWVRLRLRAALWRQWKTSRRRRAALIALGVGPRLARNTAGSGRGPWYLARSKALNIGLSNAYFRSLGLPSLIGEC